MKLFVAILLAITALFFSMAIQSLSKRIDEQDIRIHEVKDAARVGSWHLMVAQTGPHVGMSVSYRPIDSEDEVAAILLRKVGEAWTIARFDESTSTWLIEGPYLEGTRNTRGTWTPSICGMGRPGLGT